MQNRRVSKVLGPHTAAVLPHLGQAALRSRRAGEAARLCRAMAVLK